MFEKVDKGKRDKKERCADADDRKEVDEAANDEGKAKEPFKEPFQGFILKVTFLRVFISSTLVGSVTQSIQYLADAVDHPDEAAK